MSLSNKEKLEKQFRQQQLDEMGASGKFYGVQEPVIRKTKAKGREVIVNAYTLISAVLNTSNIKNKDYIHIPLGENKELAIDLVTREVLYFNDNTGEESYLDNVSFYE